jgi:lipopolysaccharide biosynthesis glycosyltransferase
MSTERIPIFFSANAGYYQHLCVTLCSLLENNKNHQFDIYVLTDDAESKENEKILQLKQQYNNFEIIFKKIDESELKSFQPVDIQQPCDHITIHAFYRCLIPNLISILDKAIYFDVDLLIEGDIRELWETNIDNYYIAGVECLYNTKNYFKNKLGFSIDDLYINSGVLVMNLTALRTNNIVNRFIENSKILIDANMPYLDQDIINYTLKGKIKELDSRFNWATSNSVESKQNSLVHKQPIISHFTGRAKPWNPRYKCPHESANRYFYYLNKTSYRHFIYRYRIEHFFRYSIKTFLKTIAKKLLPTNFIKLIRLYQQHIFVHNK